VRKLHLLAVGSLLLAAPLAAQGWNTEFGIQGGFSRFKLTGAPGAGNTIDVYGIPTPMIIGAFPTTTAAFAIIPVGDKIALEPGLSFIQQTGVSGVGPFPTIAALSLRADYAITNQFYGALGLYSRYAAGNPGSTAPYAHFQLGLEAAAGFRMHLASRLNGRIEIQAITVKKQDTNAPFNVYSLLFGVSTPLSEERPAAGGARRGTAAAAMHGDWRPEFGVSAGYSDIHVNRGPDFTVLSFPGSGSSSYANILAAATAPSLFAILPLNDRLAAEVGVDAVNIRANTQTIASFQIAPRVDLAFGHRWYGALGPQFHFIRVTSGGKSPIDGISGISLAWGYRFHLSGALDGRFEANYGMNAKRARSPVGAVAPTSVFGLNFGMMMPLK
jgi:hypothetical protein